MLSFSQKISIPFERKKRISWRQPSIDSRQSTVSLRFSPLLFSFLKVYSLSTIAIFPYWIYSTANLRSSKVYSKAKNSSYHSETSSDTELKTKKSKLNTEFSNKDKTGCEKSLGEDFLNTPPNDSQLFSNPSETISNPLNSEEPLTNSHIEEVLDGELYERRQMLHSRKISVWSSIPSM